jgi:microcystin-dependent protein
MMASAAAYRDDIAGAIATGGTSTAYTVTSYQVFDTLAHLNGQLIAFTPHATNGATVTLNVDGLGAKPLRSAPSVELPAGVLVQGTPYAALYNASDAAFYLYGFFTNPYSIPIAGGVDFWGPTAPNSSFVFPVGQAISRTTYSVLFGMVGTAYGIGDGSTTFNLPDVRARITIPQDDMGGSAASRITSAGSGVDGSTLGATGGAQSTTLITANLPAYTPAGTITNGAISISHNAMSQTGAPSSLGGGASTGLAAATITASQASSTFAGTAQGGTSTAFSRLPPTIICNYIMRII